MRVFLYALLVVSLGVANAAEYAFPEAQGAMRLMLTVPSMKEGGSLVPLADTEHAVSPLQLIGKYYYLAKHGKFDEVPQLFLESDGSRERVIEAIRAGRLNKLRNVEQLKFLGSYSTGGAEVVAVLMMGQGSKFPWQHAVVCNGGRCLLSDAAQQFGDTDLRIAGLMVAAVMSELVAPLDGGMPAAKCSVQFHPVEELGRQDPFVFHLVGQGASQQAGTDADDVWKQFSILVQRALAEQEKIDQTMADKPDRKFADTITAISSQVNFPVRTGLGEERGWRYALVSPEQVADRLRGWSDIRKAGFVATPENDLAIVFFLPEDDRYADAVHYLLLSKKDLTTLSEREKTVLQIVTLPKTLAAINGCVNPSMNKES